MAKGIKGDKKAKTIKAKRPPVQGFDSPILRLKLPASTIKVGRLRATALRRLKAGRAVSDWDDWRSSVENETEQESYSLSA